MDPSIRTRLERLEALIDAAPSPLAWVELCAALSEWPDHDRLEYGIELVRARMHAWPRALRTAPEWWRMVWERSIPEPRLVLAGTLEGPLLPATGGGSCPVQHYVYHGQRVYYVRFRSDYLSIDLESVGGRMVDRELFGAELRCIENQEIGIGGSWAAEETHAMLSMISAAIRRNDFTQIELPDSIAALRASEYYMLGPYPLYAFRLTESVWTDPFSPCNMPWMKLLHSGEPVPPAVEHHLSPTRPAALGPMPAPSRRSRFPWSPWPR